MLEDSKEEGIGKMTTKLWLCGSFIPQFSAGDEIGVACPASMDTRSSQKEDGKVGGVR